MLIKRLVFGAKRLELGRSDFLPNFEMNFFKHYLKVHVYKMYIRLEN